MHAVCLGCSPNMTQTLCGAPVDETGPDCVTCEWLAIQPCPACQPLFYAMWLSQNGVAA